MDMIVCFYSLNMLQINSLEYYYQKLFLVSIIFIEIFSCQNLTLKKYIIMQLGGGGGGQGGVNSISCTPDEKIVHLLGLFFMDHLNFVFFFIGRQANSFVRKNQYWLPELL